MYSYRARRFLQARNARFKTSGWLEAETSFGPSGFSYDVLSEGGSSTIIGKVLRPALEAERQALGNTAAAALTDANYSFTDDGFVNGWARIRMVPRRHDRLLVDGWLFVVPDSGDLVELQGRLVKSPSFWVSRVGIVRRYARIAGIRVPVSTESTAAVRFAGESTFSMHYVYEMINGTVVPADAVR